MLLWSLVRLAHVLHAELVVCVVLFWIKICDDDDDDDVTFTQTSVMS